MARGYLVFILIVTLTWVTTSDSFTLKRTKVKRGADWSKLSSKLSNSISGIGEDYYGLKQHGYGQSYHDINPYLLLAAIGASSFISVTLYQAYCDLNPSITICGR